MINQRQCILEKNRTLRSEVPFHIGNKRLDYCKEYKYLGVYFNKYLDYDSTSEHFVSSPETALGTIMAKYQTKSRNRIFNFHKIV